METDTRLRWEQPGKKVRKHKQQGRKFGVKAKNAGAAGEEGWRAPACSRLEWHYCSLKGRKEPGQRKPSKTQGREETVGGARARRPPD